MKIEILFYFQNQLDANSSNNVVNNNQNNLGPIARPRSFSTSTTKSTTINSLNVWNDKNSFLLKQQHSQANSAANNAQSNLFSAASSTSLFPSLHAPEPPPTSGAPQPPLPPQNPPVVPVPSFTGPLSSSLYDTVGTSNTSVSAGIDTMLNDLNLDELDFVKKSNSVMAENHLVAPALDTTGPANNSLNSINSLIRRRSLLNESEPINIPHRMGNDVRSTSAASFNLSPPNQLNPVAAVAAPGPIGFMTVPRQQSLPNAQSLFEQQFNNLNGVRPPTASAVPQPPPNSLASNHNFMSATFIEMQRLQEENNVAKNQIAEYQENMQQYAQVKIHSIN